MSVNIRGTEFYSESEVLAMTPSGTMDSQWETYTFTPSTGATTHWSACRFHVNKITGLVTGWIGLSNMNKMTSNLIGTNSNLAPHSGNYLRYSGQYEYGTTQSTAPDGVKLAWKELNGIWSLSGDLTLEGAPVSGTSYIQYYDTFIEHYAHIGSKYGKITSVDIKQPTYMAEGAFYDANTADLITGRAWLKTQIVLPSGYSSSSGFFVFKNLWSGEIIIQYSLYPTTAGSFPAITLPERYAVVGGRRIISDVRYWTGYTTAIQRQNSHLYIDQNHIVHPSSMPGGNWATGTFYYPGEPEVRPQNVSYEVQSLWFPEVPVAIPPATSNKWPSAAASNARQHTDGTWVDTTYYSPHSTYINWVWRSLRTGMVFTNLDITFKNTTQPNPIFSSKWGTEWVPSYRYNVTSGTGQPVYFSGAGWIQYRNSSTTTAANTEYTCNVAFYSGKALGVDYSDYTYYNQLLWGTAGMAGGIVNRACFTGFYLGNAAGNIVK